ncbi:MAG: ATP-binding cassette domain-containing protein [Bacteroidetes bacterium]|nr:ATP-binding cassette domain-containing protein [Bacteroidota bacterium]
MLIELENISKKIYKKQILSNISFSVKLGEIVGLLGPNGSGKSTTMKIISGYLAPSKGKINVCGYDVKRFPDEIKPFVSYLPENNPLYFNMYVREYLHFIGKIYGINKKDIFSKTINIMKKCHIYNVRNKKIKTLSKGFKQRVGIAQCLIHNPKILILDEPTSGLDPNHIIEIRNIIKEISKEKSVILSTHIMQEVESICDRIIIMDKGKILVDNNIENIRKDNYEHLILEIKEKINKNIFLEINKVKSIDKIENKYIIQSKNYEDIREDVFSFIIDKKLTLLGMSQQKKSIEYLFSKLIKNK